MVQQFLMGHEPTEADLVERALAQPLEAKIARAIAMFRLYEPGALKSSEAGFYLAFSGGKDSIVIKQLAIEAGVRFEPFYNNTTIDPPELIRYIRKHHPEVKWNNPKIPLLTRVVSVKGPPTRMQRWCCEEYKERGGNHRMKVIGVRIAESARRALLWKEFQPHRGDGSGILAPICYWTDADVWAFIRSRKLPYCELYDQGFTRLGCIGCPLAGPKGMRKEFDRWPGYERAWKRAVFRYYDAWHGVPTKKGEPRYFEEMGSAQALWDWWVSGKAFDGQANCVFDEMMENR